MNEVTEHKRTPKPSWLKVKIPMGENYKKVKEIVDSHKLHTICQSGNCPNIGECWKQKHATFYYLCCQKYKN